MSPLSQTNGSLSNPREKKSISKSPLFLGRFVCESREWIKKTETPEEPATVTVIDGVLSEPINVLVEVAVTVTSGEENGGEDDVLEDKELESVVEGDKDGDEEDDDDEVTI